MDVSSFNDCVINDNYFLREHGYVDGDMYRCLVCAEGCDTCVDSSPCLHERNDVLLIILLILNAAATVAIFGIAVVVYIYRYETVSKSFYVQMESDYTLVTREIWSRNYLLQTRFINPVTRLMIWTLLFYVILKASIHVLFLSNRNILVT